MRYFVGLRGIAPPKQSRNEILFHFCFEMGTDQYSIIDHSSVFLLISWILGCLAFPASEMQFIENSLRFD